MSINLTTFRIIKQYLERHGDGSSNIEIESLDITENGTYTASTGYAYNPVSVNVPAFEPAGTMVINENGTFDVTQYSAASVNVSVPPQPSGTLSISENGAYDVASYASASVNVAGAGGFIVDDIAERKISGTVSGQASFVYPYAFYDCRSLSTASFPSATTIGDYAFYSCWNMTTANFPSATTIGSYAFYSCWNMTTANFPSATTIGTQAFFRCEHLFSANFPAATSIGTSAFVNCWSMTTANFPVAISVGYNAFGDCSSLATVYIPVAKSIGDVAFRSCVRLVELHLEGVTAVPSLGNSVFLSTPIGGYSVSTGRYGSVFVPASLYNNFLTATKWSSISSCIVSV